MKQSLHEWAKNAVDTGRQIQTGALKKMDDYDLATWVIYHIDQIKRCIRNKQTLEYWPEYQSELFNFKTIEADMKYHDEELQRLRTEVERRQIP
jgi:hypothetical protein